MYGLFQVYIFFRLQKTRDQIKNASIFSVKARIAKLQAIKN